MTQPSAVDVSATKLPRGRPRKLEPPAVKRPRGKSRDAFGEKPKYRPKDPEYLEKYYIDVIKPKLESSKDENGGTATQTPSQI